MFLQSCYSVCKIQYLLYKRWATLFFLFFSSACGVFFFLVTSWWCLLSCHYFLVSSLYSILCGDLFVMSCFCFCLLFLFFSSFRNSLSVERRSYRQCEKGTRKKKNALIKLILLTNQDVVIIQKYSVKNNDDVELLTSCININNPQVADSQFSYSGNSAYGTQIGKHKDKTKKKPRQTKTNSQRNIN